MSEPRTAEADRLLTTLQRGKPDTIREMWSGAWVMSVVKTALPKIEHEAATLDRAALAAALERTQRALSIALEYILDEKARSEILAAQDEARAALAEARPEER